MDKEGRHSEALVFTPRPVAHRCRCLRTRSLGCPSVSDMEDTYRTRVAVVVPPGERSPELRNILAAAVQQAGFTPVGMNRLRDGLGATGIVAAFDDLDARSAFRLGNLAGGGVPLLAVVRDPSLVPSGVDYAVFRPGEAFTRGFAERLQATFPTGTTLT